MKNKIKTLEVGKWYWRKWNEKFDNDEDVFFVKSIHKNKEYVKFGQFYRNGELLKGNPNVIDHKFCIADIINDPRYNIRLAIDCEIPPQHLKAKEVDSITKNWLYKNAPILPYEECNLIPDPFPKLNSPNGLSFDIPKPDFIAKAKEIHNAYSEYKQLLKQKESIREALRECNTRIKEAEENIINIY